MCRCCLACSWRILPGHDTRLFARSRNSGANQDTGSPMRETWGRAFSGFGREPSAALVREPSATPVESLQRLPQQGKVSRMTDSRIPRGTAKTVQACMMMRWNRNVETFAESISNSAPGIALDLGRDATTPAQKLRTPERKARRSPKNQAYRRSPSSWMSDRYRSASLFLR